ncbi:hypothetical protein BDZ97DRAFT_207412 [Flammula alnicola]|nr:hypothetical protein BDZ97DRAFT_207412 [Flammula alnicola]
MYRHVGPLQIGRSKFGLFRPFCQVASLGATLFRRASSAVSPSNLQDHDHNHSYDDNNCREI